MKESRKNQSLVLQLSILLIFVFLCGVLAVAQTESVVHFFAGPPKDGALPESGVVSDAAGNLYGTTEYGGSGPCKTSPHFVAGCGTVFQMTPPPSPGQPWGESVLYSYQNNGDGANPFLGVTLDSAGNVYALSNVGDSSVAIEVSKTNGVWTGNIIQAFPTQQSDSYDQGGPLAIDAAGNLYGEDTGYFSGLGRIYELSPPAQQGGQWTLTVLYTFQGLRVGDGSFPSGGLTMDRSGNLYGTTQSGGINCGNVNGGCGTIFELVAPPPGGAWTEKQLYVIPSRKSGYQPAWGAVFGPGGNLYGATLNGGPHIGGTAFQLDLITGVYTVLHDFGASGDGNRPNSPLAIDPVGNLYGTLTDGPDNNPAGAVYRLTEKAGVWTETILHTFGGIGDGNTTSGELTVLPTGLYGTTVSGGGCNPKLHACGGTVYQIRP